MPRYLAIDWDQGHLAVLAANVGGGEVRVLAAARWPEEQPFGEAAAAAVGQRLKQHLHDAKIPVAPVLASLGRERLIVRDLRFPAVPGADEAAVVRFQALKELMVPAEEVVIDYTLLDAAPGQTERRAMLLVARRDQLAAYQKLCQAAGLKLAAVTARPFGAAACIDRLAGTSVLTPAPEPAGSAVAILTLAAAGGELGIARGRTVLLARHLTGGPNLAGEVKRNLAIYNGQAPGSPVRAVYVAGGSDPAAIRQKLQDVLNLPVYPVDPFEGAANLQLATADDRAALVPLWGLALLKGDAAGLPHDFLKPREPRPVKDTGRRRAYLWGGLAAAALLTAVGLGWSELNRVNRQVSAQFAENAELDRELATYDESARRIKAVTDWTDRSVVWLDELYDMTDRFPEPSRNALRLTQFSGGVVERPPNSKDKHVAKITLKGVSGEDYRPVDQLVSRLAEEPYYRPDPKKLSRNTGPDRFIYPQQFLVERVDLEKRPAEKYTRRIEPLEDGGRQAAGTELAASAAPPANGGAAAAAAASAPPGAAPPATTEAPTRPSADGATTTPRPGTE